MGAYEEKFSTFIEMCDQAKQEELECLVVASPDVLGDTHEELVESLRRLADSELALRIVPPAP